MKEFSYISFIQEALEVAECLPLKLSKYSQNTFSCRQLSILLVIRQKLDFSYRRFVKFLEITKIPEMLNLKRIPDHSTLYKFAKRVGSKLIDKFLLATPVVKQHRIAIDATGFKINRQSDYMTLRFGIPTRYRNFAKTSIAVNTKTQQVLGVVVRKGPRNDNKDFFPVLRKVKGRILSVIADKGYDAKKHHEHVIKKLHAKSVICVKENKLSSYPRSTLRKRVLKNFDHKEYPKRNVAELAFSVVKNCYGSKLRSRTIKMQKLEILLKFIAYNLRRGCLLRLST
jgi:transposase